MKDFFIKLLGFRVCTQCGRVFQSWGGHSIYQILSSDFGVQIDKKWFCHEHMPNFKMKFICGSYGSFKQINAKK